jgi:hypothetical protein|tara:strand:- start:1 stop:249 length:249 start_codon:yes stop_codon:yes gene_type:complete
MAIREKEEKKAIDNIDYGSIKKDIQKDNGMQVADISDKMTIKEINEYIKRYKSGGNTRELLKGKGLIKIELNQLQALADKRT